MTDHKALLHAIFTALNEEQRLAFLSEVFQSLPAPRQKALLKKLQPTLAATPEFLPQKPLTTDSVEESATPETPTAPPPGRQPKPSSQAHQVPIDAPPARTSNTPPQPEKLTDVDIQKLLAKAKDATLNTESSRAIATPKSDVAAAALAKFERFRQSGLEDSKKPGKKEILSCMGLGLLALTALFLLAMGLKFLFFLVFPQS